MKLIDDPEGDGLILIWLGLSGVLHWLKASRFERPETIIEVLQTDVDQDKLEQDKRDKIDKAFEDFTPIY